MEVPGWPECDTQDQAFTAIEQYRNYRDKNAREHCKSSCLKHCRIRIHSAQITKEMESRPDQSSIHIYYSSGMIQVSSKSTVDRVAVFQRCQTPV